MAALRTRKENILICNSFFRFLALGHSQVLREARAPPSRTMPPSTSPSTTILHATWFTESQTGSGMRAHRSTWEEAMPESQRSPALAARTAKKWLERQNSYGRCDQVPHLSSRATLSNDHRSR